MDKEFYQMTFQKMDDGLGALHRGVLYGYITISNNVLIWNPNGNNICLELLSQIVDKMKQLNNDNIALNVRELGSAYFHPKIKEMHKAWEEECGT